VRTEFVALLADCSIAVGLAHTPILRSRLAWKSNYENPECH
jgi:hypothetical protein